jgi:radical SAM protein with 4Fe4S-binding SPASM domain
MLIEKKYLSAPLTAQLEITDLCNHQCIHCYNLDSNVENRPVRKVSDETVISCAQKLIDGGVFAMVITGGEPLIKRELTKKVITLFRENNVKVSLNSNLTLFDDDFIVFLKETQTGVLTSCPSAIPASFEKLTGVDHYAKFETNIKKMLSAGIRFAVNMVVTKENLNEVRITAEKMKELGCKSFAATPMGLNMDYPRLDLLLDMEEVRTVIADLLWVKETLGLNVDILEALPKCVFPEKVLTEKHSFLNRKCQAGRTVIAVSCNGDVRPCAHNPVSYGNILKEDLRNIWAKMNDWRSAQYVPEGCKECTWLNRCNGGCRTSAKTIGGEWNSKEMWCSLPLKTQPPKNQKSIPLLPETQLQVNTNYLYRQEDKDIFVIYNVKEDIYFMINRAYHDFVTELKKYDTIGFADLQKAFNVTENNNQAFYSAVLFLVQKRILKRIV